MLLKAYLRSSYMFLPRDTRDDTAAKECASLMSPVRKCGGCNLFRANRRCGGCSLFRTNRKRCYDTGRRRIRARMSHSNVESFLHAYHRRARSHALIGILQPFAYNCPFVNKGNLFWFSSPQGHRNGRSGGRQIK